MQCKVHGMASQNKSTELVSMNAQPQLEMSLALNPGRVTQTLVSVPNFDFITIFLASGLLSQSMIPFIKCKIGEVVVFMEANSFRKKAGEKEVGF